MNRRLTRCALALAALHLVVGHAAARPTPRSAPRTQRTVAPPIAERADTFRAKFGLPKPNAQLRRRLNEKPVLEVPLKECALGTYEQLIAKDTIEVLYSPETSPYGHMLLRVGTGPDSVFELGFVGSATIANFHDRQLATPRVTYGCVMRLSPRKLATLKAEMKTRVARARWDLLRYELDGNSASEQNCVSFVTQALGDVAPELNVPLDNRPPQLMSHLLEQSQNVELVTVYTAGKFGGSDRVDADGCTATDTFSFHGIDYAERQPVTVPFDPGLIMQGQRQRARLRALRQQHGVY